MKRALCAGVMCVLVAAAIVAVGEAGPVLLRYRFHRGQTIRYKVTLNVTAAGGARMTKTGTNDLIVLKVGPDGSAEVRATQSSSLSGVMGAGQGRASTSTYTVSPRGQMTHVHVAGAGGAPQMMGVLMNPDAAALMQAVMPAGPVAPGAAWSQTVPAPFRGAKPLAIKTRFVGLSGTGKAQVAELRQYYVMPIDVTPTANGQAVHITGKLTMNGTTMFSLADGQITRSATNGAGDLRVVQGGSAPSKSAASVLPLSFSTVMERTK